MLLAHVQGCALSELFAYPDRPLAPAAAAAYRALVERRAQHEPVAYLVGQRAFLDLDLLVDRRVLIPRPETELLVERALSWARRWGAPRIADVGTGSGAIAVGLALALQGTGLPQAELHVAERPQAALYALDSSPGALSVARQNAARYGVADKITFLQGDLLDPLPGPVDLIVANLPYVSEDEYAALPPGIRDYEPRAALVAGPDGLDVIRRLLRTARPHLALDATRAATRAAILLEIGAAQGAAVSALAAAAFPDARVEVIPDYGGRDRVVEIEIRSYTEMHRGGTEVHGEREGGTGAR
jgi:release factor glutamine methyltransferase